MIQNPHRLILFPLKKESEFFTRELESLVSHTRVDLSQNESLSYFPSLKLFVSSTGIGQRSFENRAVKIIEQIQTGLNVKISLLMGAGSAGALHSDLKLGDLVLGVESVAFVRLSPHPTTLLRKNEKGLQKDTFLVKSSFPSSLMGLLNKKKLFSSETYQIICGSIASCNSNILTNQDRRQLFQATRSLATAWEGAALAHVASNFQSMDFFEIRGITDVLNDSVELNQEVFLSRLPLVMGHLAQFINHFLKVD